MERDNSCIPPRFKIDASSDSWWKFMVYERMSFLGIKFWGCVYKTDDLGQAIAHVKQLQKIPLYYR
ncbi:hypothetical protein ACQZ40_20165 [Agrobacterium sp. 16-172Ci]